MLQNDFLQPQHQKMMPQDDFLTLQDDFAAPNEKGGVLRLRPFLQERSRYAINRGVLRTSYCLRVPRDTEYALRSTIALPIIFMGSKY